MAIRILANRPASTSGLTLTLTAIFDTPLFLIHSVIHVSCCLLFYCYCLFMGCVCFSVFSDWGHIISLYSCAITIKSHRTKLSLIELWTSMDMPAQTRT